mmetsp:Transcript_79575/g.125523  ORF Transcript_79575/g.125523 Transcript_79575/m.125523 type:complete len:85 (-) Transcript_79575:620-874(-)
MTEPIAKAERLRRSDSGSKTSPVKPRIQVLALQSAAGRPAKEAIDAKESPRIMAYDKPPTAVLNITVSAGRMAEILPNTLAHMS